MTARDPRFQIVVGHRPPLQWGHRTMESLLEIPKLFHFFISSILKQ
jgi:hypothetical protein